ESRLCPQGGDRARRLGRLRPRERRADRAGAGDPAQVPREHPLGAAARRHRPQPARGGGRLLARAIARRDRGRRRHPRGRGAARERARRAARAARVRRLRRAAAGRLGRRARTAAFGGRAGDARRPRPGRAPRGDRGDHPGPGGVERALTVGGTAGSPHEPPPTRLTRLRALWLRRAEPASAAEGSSPAVSRALPHGWGGGRLRRPAAGAAAAAAATRTPAARTSSITGSRAPPAPAPPARPYAYPCLPPHEDGTTIRRGFLRGKPSISARAS